MALGEYFSSENRTSRVKERAKKRAQRRDDFKERDKAREKAGGLSFRKVGGAVRDVGLGILGLTPKDKARQRKAVKAAKGGSDGYTASYSASASSNKDGLMMAGAAVAAIAVAAAVMGKKEG